MGLKGVSVAANPAANIDVGVSVITGGTSGNILYDAAGTLGEMVPNGTGAPVLTTGPTFVTPILGVATATSLTASGAVSLFVTATVSTGGVTGRGITFSTAANFGVFFGAGAPTLIAQQGSLYLRSDGTTVNDRLFVAAATAGVWIAVTTTA